MTKRKISGQDVLAVDFFHDFIEFLKYLEAQPIKRTVTGKISLYDIAQLRKRFRLQTEADRIRKKMGWQIRSEREVENLTQIKVIAEIMHLTYKRKRKLFLSKNGKKFLYSLSPLEQYSRIVLCYWKEVNWAYFSAGRMIKGKCVTEVLQDNQELIWRALLFSGGKWLPFLPFCLTLKEYLHLHPFYQEDRDDFDLRLDITFALFKRNLVRLGCVEVEKGRDKNGLEEVLRFRPTRRGLLMFRKALFENYYSQVL